MVLFYLTSHSFDNTRNLEIPKKTSVQEKPAALKCHSVHDGLTVLEEHTQDFPFFQAQWFLLLQNLSRFRQLIILPPTSCSPKDILMGHAKNWNMFLA